MVAMKQQPLTIEEIQRAVEESSRSGNYFLYNAIKSMADELRELRDQHAMSHFIQELEHNL
jgi:hypothetical protein